jgi:ubiquinone biosynthesis protein
VVRGLVCSLRLFKIIFVLAKNGALAPLRELKIAKSTVGFFSILFFFVKERSLADALENLGPIFVKFGQMLSTRADLIGDEMADDLSKLQDKLAPFDSDIAIEILEEELGDKLENLFAEFDRKSVAAASIAQVHKAIMHDGKLVAVKILRPGIEEAFTKDIALFYWITSKAEKRLPKFKRLKVRDAVAVFETSVKNELDLRFEAAAASELRENLKSDTDILVPEVYWDKTSHRVMTLEWVDGISIYDKQGLKDSGFDVNKLASIIAITFFEQAFRDGFFHADLHPGNIFVTNKGKIALVDFGIMGRLDKGNRIFVAEVLHGFLTRNYDRIAKIHFERGIVPRHKSMQDFAQACRSIGEPIIGQSVGNVSIAKLLALLFKVAKDFEMETQPQLILLQKTMVLVEGIGSRLNPEVNMWHLAEPWIKNWAIDNIGIEARIKDRIKEIVDLLFNKLPEKIKKDIERV